MVEQEYKMANVLGYNVNLFSFNICLATIISLLNDKQSAHIVTINPEMISEAEKNVEFSKILKSADFLVPDGVGIKMALKLQGISQETIPGIELSEKLIEYCASKGYAVSFIGANEEVINEAISKLKSKYPGLNITFKQNGYFKVDDEERIITALKNSVPYLVLVALGAPKQEFFINKCRETIDNAVFIGVGGSFDVWAGKVKRAPVIFRKLSLEWLYRTIKEPKRFKRIFPTLPLFLFKVIMNKYKK